MQMQNDIIRAANIAQNGRIVAELAKEKRVELMVQKIAHQSLSPDLKDLSQMVYEIILNYDHDKVLDLWENGQINFFIARIILNQFRSSTSPFHTIYRKFSMKASDITGLDFTDTT